MFNVWITSSQLQSTNQTYQNKLLSPIWCFATNLIDEYKVYKFGVGATKLNYVENSNAENRSIKTYFKVWLTTQSFLSEDEKGALNVRWVGMWFKTAPSLCMSIVLSADVYKMHHKQWRDRYGFSQILTLFRIWATTSIINDQIHCVKSPWSSLHPPSQLLGLV